MALNERLAAISVLSSRKKNALCPGPCQIFDTDLVAETNSNEASNIIINRIVT